MLLVSDNQASGNREGFRRQMLSRASLPAEKKQFDGSASPPWIKHQSRFTQTVRYECDYVQLVRAICNEEKSFENIRKSRRASTPKNSFTNLLNSRNTEAEENKSQ